LTAPESIMPDDPNLKEEIRRMAAEPLLPVEKKLIAGSLILGVILLAILVWVSRHFFPGSP
jgi:hypothetical protein